MTLEPLGDGRLQITFIKEEEICNTCDCETRCGSTALLTVRGKDHSITKAGVESLARALVMVASKMEEGPPGVLAME